MFQKFIRGGEDVVVRKLFFAVVFFLTLAVNAQGESIRVVTDRKSVV